MANNDVVLKVEEPDPSHVGRNIITLDMQTKQVLGITSGDIVEIEGTKKTAAIVWPARPEDEARQFVRMDSYVRHNAGVGLGEKVTVRKADVKEARKVVLAPTEEIRIIASGYDKILKKSFLGRPLTIGDSVWVSVFGSGRGFVYKVVESNPRGTVKITDATDFVLKEKPTKGELEGLLKVAYEDIGGLGEQVQKVREMIELPMRHPELFRKLGIDPPKGVLLFGAPGTGKTLLAKAVANETNAHFISVNAPAIMSKFVGEAEERVRQIFKEAEDNAPSIIFIDEIDAIAPKREEVIGEVERRVVAQILALMDGLESRGGVIVIAATNRINSIDEALRRPGRFDREIELPVPDKKARKQILQIHTRGMPVAKNVDLDYFANIAHGFVGADLSALTKEAAMKALRRYLPKINLEEETIPPEVLESLEVNKNDFLEGLKDVQPSALREVTIEIPNIKWTDIGGLDDVKDELKQVVEWPLKYPDAFKKMGIKPPKGVLLYGPPGCGKTLLAKAVATESEANFISVKGPELLSMWVGQSEQGIRKIFKKARQVAPAIIFFDEIDSIATTRGINSDSGATRRVVNQLLTELDGIQELNDVVFLAATNMPWLLDSALLRPGRIDKPIRVDVPNETTRLAILKVHTSGMNLAKNVSLEELAKKTENFTGAAIQWLGYEAALLALTENVDRETRNKILADATKNIELAPNVSLDDISEKVKGFTKDALKKLCEELAIINKSQKSKPVQEHQIFEIVYKVLQQFKEKIAPDPKPIEKRHFEEILVKIAKGSASITKEKEKVYDEFEENIGSMSYVG